jgi:hypothetical protein
MSPYFDYIAIFDLYANIYSQGLNRVEDTTYLGRQITQEMDVKQEIQHKMHQTYLDIENVVQLGHLLEDNSLF